MRHAFWSRRQGILPLSQKTIMLKLNYMQRMGPNSPPSNVGSHARNCRSVFRNDIAVGDFCLIRIGAERDSITPRRDTSSVAAGHRTERPTDRIQHRAL